MSRIIFDNNEFEKIDAGGNANVVENWTSFETYAENILGVNSKNDYKVEMGRSGTHASVIECKAAADCYRINIIVMRLNNDGSHFRIDNSMPNYADTIYLLLTGNHNDNIRDSHFQILKPVNNNSNNYYMRNNDNSCNFDFCEIAPKSGRPAIPVDIFLQGMIRQTIHGFYAEKMYPSLEMVHKKLQECEHIPDFKLTTLKTWCKKLNFSYKKFNKKTRLDGKCIGCRTKRHLSSSNSALQRKWLQHFLY
ncbi:Protein of unknown function [Cotesia congregata]|uniref:Uncharacterized protein n=1 Tax=Cotesia congregata TaxID=51543 RepID=A0A8J2MZC4_COTCN|nr:Protein of unknown function [Cotesia congregata]